MSLLRPHSAINFLHSTSSSCTSSLYPRLLFHRSKNGAMIDCRFIGGRTLMSSYGKKGLVPLLPFSSLDLDASTSNDPHFMSSSVGSPPQSLSLSQWNLGPRHILLLNIIACTVAISASWLFFSAIPTLLAFKRAAESLEKLLDVTAEELPDTMATMRLCGMEITDLTMELSDLGQGIKQGVRNSTRTIRVAEERLRHLTTMDPIAGLLHSNGKKIANRWRVNSATPILALHCSLTSFFCLHRICRRNTQKTVTFAEAAKWSWIVDESRHF